MGHTVNFRSHKQSYKDKNPVMNPKEEWLIFEDTHEAIVDKETWELAQKLRKTPRRHDTLGEANPLTGLLFCADCGAKMTNHRSRGGTENNPYPSDFYDCSSYTLAHQKRTHACSGHYIRTKALRELILETVRTASTFAITNPDEFMEKVRSASQIRQAEAAKETKRKLNKDRKRITELDNIIKKLYETFAVGRISDERFDSLLAEYETEQKALVASVAEAEQRLSCFEEDTDRAEQFLSLAKKYTDFSELTTTMINEFTSVSETARNRASPPPSSTRHRLTDRRSNIPTKSVERKCICRPPKLRSTDMNELTSTRKAPSSADRIPLPSVGTARNSLWSGASRGQT